MLDRCTDRLIQMYRSTGTRNGAELLTPRLPLIGTGVPVYPSQGSLRVSLRTHGSRWYQPGYHRTKGLTQPRYIHTCRLSEVIVYLSPGTGASTREHASDVNSRVP